MEDTEKYDLEEEYSKVALEKSLPSFNELLADFDVDKISLKETKFLPREIRRAITEKISAYLHLFESLINPSSTPVFIFSAMKKQNKERSIEINKIYKELSRIQLRTLLLDTVYDEQKESEFIKDSFQKWQTLKKSIYNIIEQFEINLDEESTNNSSGYFG